MTVARKSATKDPRGDARLIDLMLAIQLVLISRPLIQMDVRAADMISWLLTGTVEDLEPNGSMPVHLFMAAIEATKL